MKRLNQLRIITLVLAFAALVVTATPAPAALITGNGGGTFELTPSATPGILTDSANGVVRVSSLGNCSFHAQQVITLPTAPDQPILVKGIWRFTSSDGATTLDAEVEGTGTPDPANPGFVNLHYDMKFTGGTGQMANAQGRAKIDVLVMFNSATSGTSTFILKGVVFTQGHHDPDRKNR